MKPYMAIMCEYDNSLRIFDKNLITQPTHSLKVSSFLLCILQFDHVQEFLLVDLKMFQQQQKMLNYSLDINFVQIINVIEQKNSVLLLRRRPAQPPKRHSRDLFRSAECSLKRKDFSFRLYLFCLCCPCRFVWRPAQSLARFWLPNSPEMKQWTQKNLK